jgi:hypothetical protein
MTGKAMELRESKQAIALTSDQLKFISNTEFVPAGLRGNMPAILACVTTGRELGLGDMTALRSIHIIDGKATFSAELMVQLVRQAGHSITGDVTAESAKVVGKRADNGDTMTVEWTLTMAERVGLLSKSNWKKYPEAMLWARAVSQLCRMLFADCFAGASYTPDELGAGDVTADELMDEAGVVVEEEESIETLTATLLDLADALDVRAKVEEAIAEHADDVEWLQTQISNARESLAAREAQAEAS